MKTILKCDDPQWERAAMAILEKGHGDVRVKNLDSNRDDEAVYRLRDFARWQSKVKPPERFGGVFTAEGVELGL